ncbi:uncharacterized protein B0T15DRAFT_400579 [Chaetomium strumarium]|uniref:Uncharacterized protein n=1 Tax=Chaetomium strumarium TaxID=1170767 RepID=A0AAJ0M0F3_9PEZI|nr:hypothetical protein B0T15DRAFT_400579 [Chaetomium strumarium]
MDGAAKDAERIAKQYLPERPHHLSLFFDRRFPRPDGWSFLGPNHPLQPSDPLQYTTYLSTVQRGILITRAAFEICDEPPLMPTKVVAKGEVRKKLSLTDYHKRKKSESPVENGVSAKPDAKANGTVPNKPPPPKGSTETGDGRAVGKPHAPVQANTRPDRPRPDTNGDSRTKSPQTNPQPQTDSRKRPAEADGHPSPQKRAKGEGDAKNADQFRLPPKPGTPRGREGVTEKLLMGGRADTLHHPANGLAPPSSKRDRDNTASPKSTIQVNGSRPRSDSGTSTLRKWETVTKSALPELLSPLHPSLFAGPPGKEGKLKKPLEKAPRPEKEKVGASPPPRTTKKQLKIPRLLSPTLPTVVEEVLSQKAWSQSQPKGQGPDSSSGARKTIVAAPTVRVVAQDEDEEEEPAKAKLVLTFKLKKANAKRAEQLLSLPSKSAKDAQKKERSTSTEVTPPPPPATKRPRLADDVPQETSASKRTKTAAVDVVAGRPPAAAMSRVASNQSQGATPAAAAGLTPGAADNRPPTRSEPLDPKTLAQVEACKERHAEYSRLGSKLKHTRDGLCRERGPAGMTPADERLATALHFEMVLAYMVAFHSLNQARMLERKVCEIAAWETLLPHLAELRNRVQGNRALKALSAQMHVLCLEQITNAFATLDPAAAASCFLRWAKHNRNRAAMWQEANALWERVEEQRMKTAVGPWTSIEEAVAAALGIMRHWTHREGLVSWQPLVNPRAEKEGDRDRENDRDRDRERDRRRDRERERPRPSLNGTRH